MDEVAKILEAHREWRQSDEASGSRGDLSYGNFFFVGNARQFWFPYGNMRGARWMGSDMRDAVFANADLRRASLNDTDLRGASFADCDLRGAYLRNARLAGAYFKGADLRGAFLEGANLESADRTEAEIEEEREEVLSWYEDDDRDVPEDLEIETRTKPADISGARLRNADFSEARLTDVVGLRSDSLAGTVLTNAKLPPDIARFDMLEHVTEISKSASTTFLGMLAGCAYCLLTMATTDIRGAGTVTLPIIDSDISAAGFFIVAPVVLVGVYIYLHMHLLRLWQGLGTLPARFPDGRALDEKAYPWLLTSLVQLYVPKLRADRAPLWWLQAAISIITAWLLVPGTVLAFVAVVFAAERWIGGTALVFVAAVSAAVAWVTFRLASRYLTGDTS